ncbi:MAG: tetratricopeptide repeat protein [Rhodothermales bacterium]
MRIQRPASRSPWLFLLLLFVLPLGLSGCKALLGQRYENFTAYYNKFYQAKKLYGEGVESVEIPDERVDRDRFMNIFTTPSGGAGARSFGDAVQKSADVLREKPTSKWVDDALLLIGKSYYYLKNDVGAEQKFDEVIELGGALEDEARFWKARTLITRGTAQSYELAFEHLQESLAREGLSNRWEPMLLLALSELHVQRQEWEPAADALQQSLDKVRDRQLGGRAQFLLGQVLEQLGRYEEAIIAYERVSRFKPLYELSYAAQYSAVRVQGEHGDGDLALRQLRRMERDDKNFSYETELAYLRGHILQAQERYVDAEDVYYDLLYFSDTGPGQMSGRIHYGLATLNRDVYVDYVLASAHFDTAATTLGRSGAPRATTGSSGIEDILYSSEAITDSKEMSDVFKEFRTAYDEVYRLDSLLTLGYLDDEAFDARVLELREALAEEMQREQEALAKRQAEQRFGGNAADNIAQSTGSRTTGGVTATAASSSEAGFLSYKDPVALQEARARFIELWGERPLVPNWRRQAVINLILAEAEESGNLDALLLTSPVEGEAALPQLDVSDIPRDSLSQAVMESERALARYAMGNVLFFLVNRPDSASVWYRMVIDETPEEEVAQRSYYALAEVQRSLGDSLAADQLYQRVLAEYPKSDFAERVREQLGIPSPEVAPDSTMLAETAYATAYDAWQAEQYHAAMNDMLRVTALYPTTATAPRAMLAAASVYTEWATRDSLDLFAKLPVELPDSLLLASGIAEAMVMVPESPQADSTATDGAMDTAPADSTAVPATPNAVDAGDVDELEPPLEEQGLVDEDGELLREEVERRQADANAGKDETEAAIDDLDAPPPPQREVEDEVDDMDLDTVEVERPQRVEDEIDDGLDATPPQRETRDPEDDVSSDVQAVTPEPTDSTQTALALSVEPLLADSLAIVSDSLAVPADSVQALPEAEPLFLTTLYERLESLFGDSEAAKLADRRKAVLDEILADRKALADSLAALEAARVDSLQQVAMADSLGIPLDSLAAHLAAFDLAPTDSTQTPLPTDVATTEDAAPQDSTATGASDLPPIDERTWYDETEVEVKPQLIGGRRMLLRLIKYPPEAAEEEAEAEVTVEFLVDKRGRVVDPIVLEEQGYGFDEEAIRVISMQRFSTGKYEGEAVITRMKMSIPFALSGDEEDER